MKKILSVLASALPVAAMAHPGHGDSEGFSIIHYFTEPVHVLVGLGAVLLFSVFYTRFFGKKESKNQ